MTFPARARRAALFATALATAQLACSGGTPAEGPRALALADVQFGLITKEVDAACFPRDVTREDEIETARNVTNACLARTLGSAIATARSARGAAASAAIAAEAAEFETFSYQFAHFDAQRRPLGVVESSGNSCPTTALEERIAYARWLAQGDAQALAAHVGSTAARAARTRKQFAAFRAINEQIREREARSSGATGSAASNFRNLLDVISELEQRAKVLGRSSCATFPGLPAALGDARPCEERMTDYYLAHCRVGSE